MDRILEIVKQGSDLNSKVEKIRYQFLTLLENFEHFHSYSPKMDLFSHSGRACLCASRHSCLTPLQTGLDCRLLGRQFATSSSSPIRRTSGRRVDTPVIKRGLSYKRKSSGADKENFNGVLRPEQRSPSVGLTARLALFPCVAARSNSSSQQLLEKNTGACIGGFNNCPTVPSYETDAVEISQGSPELSSGSTSVWSADDHDFSQTLVSSEDVQDFDPNTSSVRFLPPTSPLRSSSPLSGEQCSGSLLCKSATERRRGFSSTAEIENVYTGRSLRDVSSISQTSTTSLHEQISGSSLIGAFCSTFSYPLHSTIIDEHNSLSPISTADTDLQHCDGDDASSNPPDPVTDETLVKTRWRCLDEPHPTCAGSYRELTNIYLSPTNKTAVEDYSTCRIPPYSPSRLLIPLVQNTPCKFNCSRMFASQYDGTQRSTDNLGSSGFAETTDVFNISSHMSSTSNSLRVNLNRKLKRQIGCARLDALLHHRTRIIPRSRSTIEDDDKNESLSFLATRSLSPRITEFSHGDQSRISQLNPTRFPQMPTILEMAEKNRTPCSPSSAASRNPNNDTEKQGIPSFDMSETSRNIHEPLRPHKGIQCKNSLDVSPCVTMVPCCVEHHRESHSHVNKTRTRLSFRHRDTDNVHSKCCCSENVSRTVYHMQQTEGVLGRSSRTKRCSTSQQIHHLQRRKALMRKLRHFRRTIYGDDDESKCQFKIFAQI